MTNDCKGCTVRRIGCHANCSSYQAFCADNEADKAAKKAYLDKHNAPNGVLINGYIRRKKKQDYSMERG